MRRPILVVILLLLMIVIIVGTDVLFLSETFLYRLIFNIVVFLIFVAIYLKFFD